VCDVSGADEGTVLLPI